METYFLGWIVFFVLICLLELATQQLVAIWFAAGSLVCVFLSYFGYPLYIQLIIFIVVSCVTLLLLRPYAIKKVNANVIKTNIHEAIGKKAIVIADFDKMTREGRVQLEGMDWAARSVDDKLLRKNETVVIKAIEGVKFMVQREES